MPKTIKVGVITQPQGAHLPDYFGSLAKIEEVEAVVLADPTEKTAEAARKVLGDKLKQVYKDSAEMLKRFEPHLAVVSLEAIEAPPAIDAALEAGCHVFAEKPSCTRAEDFAALTRKAQLKHRHLMLAVANRSHAPVREARRLIAEGKLGKVYGVEVHLVTDQTRLKAEEYRKSWFCSKTRGGGGQLIWVGIHWLDLALHVTGLKVRQVAGFAGVVGGQPIDVEDSAALSLRFDNGSFGTMTSGYYLDKGYQSHLQIWGEHGWLRLAAVEELPLEWYSTKDVKEPKVERFEYPKGGRGYLNFLKAAVRAAAGLDEAPVTAEEGLHVLRSIFAFLRSSEDGPDSDCGVNPSDNLLVPIALEETPVTLLVPDRRGGLAFLPQCVHRDDPVARQTALVLERRLTRPILSRGLGGISRGDAVQGVGVGVVQKEVVGAAA